MGKKQLKRFKENRTVPPSHEFLPSCPLCKTTNPEKAALAAFDDLLQSHAELCSVIRSVGRQMLQIEKPDRHSLDRLRIVLKRADNIRQTLRLQDEYQENLKKQQLDASCAPSEGSSEQTINEAAIQKSKARGHLSRPRSIRIVRSPAC